MDSSIQATNADAPRGVCKKPKVCLAFCNGCPRSFVSAAKISEFFRRNDYVESSAEEADTLIASGCGVNIAAEDNAMALLRLIKKRMKPSARLIIIGCLAGTTREAVEEEFNATCLTVATITDLGAILGASVGLSEISDPNEPQAVVSKAWRVFSRFDRIRAKCSSLGAFLRPWQISLSFLSRRLLNNCPDNDNGEGYYLRVASGCSGRCTYCALRFYEGPFKSKPIEAIRAEFEKGLAAEAKLFRLIAPDVGAWGHDMGERFPQLLRMLFDHSGDFRIVILDVSPKWIIRYLNELIEALKGNSEKIDHLHIPIQSGSDSILQAMRREYLSTQLRAALDRIRTELPGIPLRTHVIVGFPGETEEDFGKTMRVVTENAFEEIIVFPYSDRPNTEASEMDGKVSKRVIRSRMLRLRKKFPDTTHLVH